MKLFATDTIPYGALPWFEPPDEQGMVETWDPDAGYVAAARTPKRLIIPLSRLEFGLPLLSKLSINAVDRSLKSLYQQQEQWIQERSTRDGYYTFVKTYGEQFWCDGEQLIAAYDVGLAWSENPLPECYYLQTALGRWLY